MHGNASVEPLGSASGGNGKETGAEVEEEGVCVREFQ